MSDDVERAAIEKRKRDHVRLCLEESSQFSTTTTAGFERYGFVHAAFPEMAPEDVDLEVELLGKRIAAPILVSSMTGGTDEGGVINRNIAIGAQAAGVAMAVGSQRIAIRDPRARASFDVREAAPDIPLYANLGAVQLNYGFGDAEARELVQMIGADGLFLHLNPLQEVVQPEGNTNFRGLFEKVCHLAAAVPFPVLVKETGCGISGALVAALTARGIAAVDVSGAGGTSFAKVEGLRAETPDGRSLGATFGDWGIPTAVAIREAREAAPHARIIASGGIRNGLDVAKAIALGADIASLAKPVLAAALDSGAAVEAHLRRIARELRIVCFLVGARSVQDLRRPGVLRGPR